MLAPCDASTLDALLLWVPSEPVRRAAHSARSAAYGANAAVLERLVDARDRYAHLQGFPSYAHYHVHAQYAKGQHAVASPHPSSAILSFASHSLLCCAFLSSPP